MARFLTHSASFPLDPSFDAFSKNRRESTFPIDVDAPNPLRDLLEKQAERETILVFPFVGSDRVIAEGKLLLGPSLVGASVISGQPSRPLSGEAASGPGGLPRLVTNDRSSLNQGRWLTESIVNFFLFW